MTKKILFILCGGTLVLSACSTTKTPTPQKIGMPNPASQYCIDQGGKLEMKKNANGDAYANLFYQTVVSLKNGNYLDKIILKNKTQKKLRKHKHSELFYESKFITLQT